MCDTQQGASREFRLDGLLQLRVRLDIDAARGFIQNNDAAPFQQRSRQREQLLLPRAEISTFDI